MIQMKKQAMESRFHDLLVEFGKLTGCPVVLNTSFNDADEPIVCSPGDAIRSFLHMGLDALVMGPFVVGNDATWNEAV